MTPIALTIAGSDSSGGAGIEADLKTFSALGVYGATVITALTAQNTKEVRAIHAVPAEFVAAQIDAVFSDLRVNAVKIGMLWQAEVIETVAAALGRWDQGKRRARSRAGRHVGRSTACTLGARAPQTGAVSARAAPHT